MRTCCRGKGKRAGERISHGYKGMLRSSKVRGESGGETGCGNKILVCRGEGDTF